MNTAPRSALRCALWLALPASTVTLAVAAPRYSVLDLGPTSSFPPNDNYSINESGMVVGNTISGGQTRAFIWDSVGGFRVIPTGGSSSYTQATGVNAAGRVSGSTNFSGLSGPSHAFTYTENGGYVNLGSYSGNNTSIGNGINDNGTVVGWAGAPDSNRAYRWNPGTGYELLEKTGDLQATFGNAISNSGVVVGTVNINNQSRAARWSVAGNYEDLTDPAGIEISFGKDVNSSGTALGNYWFATQPTQTILWRPDGSSLLLPVGGGALVGQDINDGEVVVGNRGSGSSAHAFIWTEDEGVLNLNTLLNASGAGWTLRDASGINNSGSIVGWGLLNGQQRVYLLTPVPEPGTLAALGFGALALLRRRRK